MRIVEKYGAGMKALAGKGPWVFLTPARFLLAGLYEGWLRARGGSRRTGVKPRTARDARIVSIGNLQAGGSGKTPCTIALAEAVRGNGGRPVVVTRGYGAAAERAGLPVVLPGGGEVTSGAGYTTEGEFISARGEKGGARREEPSARAGQELPLNELSRIFGDEVLAYRSRGIPVIIDPDRSRGVEAAARLLDPSVILLDDAFQHRCAYRDLDILLLDAEQPFAGGRLLPFGYLREKPDAVARADAVIFTRALSETIPAEAAPYVKDKPVFYARHRCVDLLSSDGSTRELAYLEGKSVILFAGLARHDSFEQLVSAAGADPQVSYRYPDHHVYDQGDIGEIAADTFPGAVFITTEKDWPKSVQFFDTGHEVLALRIRMEIEGMERLLAFVTGAV
jgi:tetraacyldisaccharide 4'-kinase